MLYIEIGGKMGNLLDALINLKNTENFLVSEGESGNTIQKVGSGLETFIKDMLSGTLDPRYSKEQKKKEYEKTFSYAGNANNPPDIILENGDAIEVKKVDSLTGGIQLNSSPPKSKLLTSDTRINKACKDIALREGWTEKDIFYAVGSLDGAGILRRLWLVYGDCFAAEHDIYERIAERVSNSINESFEETELSETNELASVPNVDPMGITRLRVRGMWIVKNPSIIFEDIIPASKENAEMRVYCLMLESKYLAFSESVRHHFESKIDDKMVMHNVEIQNPNNPAELMKARLIVYEI